MSMSTLTILQVTIVFMIYIGLTCCLPFWLLNRKLRGFRLCVKLMLSYLFGNFYIINLVFALQLLHISNPVTLILGVLIPFFWVKAKFENWHVLEFLRMMRTELGKVLRRELGLKSLLFRVFSWIGAQVAGFLKKCFRVIRRNPVDTVLFLAYTALVAVMYGKNLINTFGYCTSDLPVHNYWINYLSRGKLFVAGVYPFGFHCMMYYIHAVSGVPTYVLMRVFCFVQTMFIHWALLFVLKACLKSRYIAYGAAGFYAGSLIFSGNTYLRFFNSLPQEFGMIFILPAVFFGFAYFKYRKEELVLAAAAADTAPETETAVEPQPLPEKKKQKKRKKEKREKREKKPLQITRSTWCLFGFAMSFALTLVGHFYDTIIAGLFCLAMAIAYFFRFFTKKYFGWVVLTVFASVMIAVLPMGIAFVTGTPLEGSLNWAMGVMSEPTEDGSGAATDLSDDADSEQEENVESADEGQSQESSPEAGETAGQDGAAGDKAGKETGETEEVTPPSLVDKVKNLVGTVDYVVRSYVFSRGFPLIRYSIYGCCVLLVVLSLVFFLWKKPDYGAQMVSVSLYVGLLSLLIISSRLGIPQLMDPTRTSIYYAYALPVLWGFTGDAILVILLSWTRRRWILNLASFAAVGMIAGVTVREGLVREPRVITALETNGAITCLTNIIRENDNWTWTICSANDELRMLEDYGYHYEPIDLLRKMEGIGRYADLTIPTKYIYFYIEKIPLDYYGTYENSGQPVSKEGAERALPMGSGLPLYYTENRWIIMSRMYYWAEEFQKIHPNEMQVYYESENFICYRLEQNVNKLFDLAIDYGYNNGAGTSQ